jgi:hypothetical protein
MLSNDGPFVADEGLETFNADVKSEQFHDWIVNMKPVYQGNNLFICMGDDFRFQNALEYFNSSDQLIQYYNEHIGAEMNVELIYSTPSIYIDAVAEENIEWPTKYDDMFPYANDENSYWTGYFSSRANDKEYIRKASRNMNSSSMLYAMNALNLDAQNE